MPVQKIAVGVGVLIISLGAILLMHKLTSHAIGKRPDLKKFILLLELVGVGLFVGECLRRGVVEFYDLLVRGERSRTDLATLGIFILVFIGASMAFVVLGYVVDLLLELAKKGMKK